MIGQFDKQSMLFQFGEISWQFVVSERSNKKLLKTLVTTRLSQRFTSFQQQPNSFNKPFKKFKQKTKIKSEKTNLKWDKWVCKFFKSVFIDCSMLILRLESIYKIANETFKFLFAQKKQKLLVNCFGMTIWNKPE